MERYKHFWNLGLPGAEEKEGEKAKFDVSPLNGNWLYLEHALSIRDQRRQLLLWAACDHILTEKANIKKITNKRQRSKTKRQNKKRLALRRIGQITIRFHFKFHDYWFYINALSIDSIICFHIRQRFLRQGGFRRVIRMLNTWMTSFSSLAKENWWKTTFFFKLKHSKNIAKM